jgi:hypothetical protein
MRVALLALICGCVTSVPPTAPVVQNTAPQPPPVKIPEGCERDLSGEYAHAEDPSYRYSARDDGGTLELSAGRTFADGGAGAPTIRLTRGPDGFKGETKALAALPSGETCEMTFPTAVQACPDDGLVLESASSGSVGEGCTTPTRPRNAVMLVHKLTRADAGAKSSTP